MRASRPVELRWAAREWTSKPSEAAAASSSPPTAKGEKAAVSCQFRERGKLFLHRQAASSTAAAASKFARPPFPNKINKMGDSGECEMCQNW